MDQATRQPALEDDLETRMEGAAVNLAEQAAALDEQLRTCVSKRPAVALLAAVACGFVIGRVLSR
jgi:hypothetical protein